MAVGILALFAIPLLAIWTSSYRTKIKLILGVAFVLIGSIGAYTSVIFLTEIFGVQTFSFQDT